MMVVWQSYALKAKDVTNDFSVDSIFSDPFRRLAGPLRGYDHWECCPQKGYALNYYPHHIGDFNNATRHLTRIERSIYRDLIELYYDTEKPLPLDITKLTRLVCANNPSETQSVILVIEEFFEKTEKGYVNRRCELEINNYKHRADIARANGKQGGRPIGARDKTKRVILANPELTQTKANQNHNHNQEPNKDQNHLPKVEFDFATGTFSNINGQIEIWRKAYPAINLEGEIAKAAAWLVANPKNRKSNYPKFLTNWFSRCQDKAPASKQQSFEERIGLK